jgi:hypothetical protein
MAAKHCVVGGFIEITSDEPELGLDGMATVLSIEPCPAIQKGPGQIVLTTTNHYNDFVYELSVQGQEKPIGVTGWHQLFSATRNDWVHVKDLVVGEILVTQSGSAEVKALERKPGRFTVFNLEVERDHNYFVSESSVLSHNAGCGPVYKGQAGVNAFEQDFVANGGIILGREISLRGPNGLTRPDLYGIAPGHTAPMFIEIKTGPTAALNPNQIANFPDVRRGLVTPVGGMLQLLALQLDLHCRQLG